MALLGTLQRFSKCRGAGQQSNRKSPKAEKCGSKTEEQKEIKKYGIQAGRSEMYPTVSKEVKSTIKHKESNEIFSSDVFNLDIYFFCKLKIFLIA